ncbi:UvrD-helicase domain-containing protein [Parapedobacter sp. SGR-10]|uniref:UvrD-helicase domain-containing protein n=1 Tax=Parapedobacter sp. SGR-10 TaxID=2710879 RepID=UPI0013D08733|nr:UvrD-helicase domain-containing protein [Parapedobacter sp. SGR-10]NGF55138.1 UvrD-helicase domain-containing protein [Parapedobacter sp. SGR-10]
MTSIAPLKLLKASAGSGKTFNLAAHYLTLLFAHEYKYREILAVTFTNKATEEMKTRILEVLKGLAQNDPATWIDDYRKIISRAYPTLSPWELQERADSIYRRILHDYSRFSVSTIDGFVQKVIRSFAFELGLDSNYTLEMNIDKVKESLVERLDKDLDRKPELVDWIIQLAKERIEDDRSWNYKGELLGLASEIFKERFADFEKALLKIGHENLDKTFADYAKDTRAYIRQVEETIVQKAGAVHQAFLKSNLTPDDLKQKSRNPLLTKLPKIVNKEFHEISALAKLIDQPANWFQPKTDESPYYTINPLLKELYHYYTAQQADYILAQQFQKNVYYLRLMQEMAALLKTYRDETGSLLISDAQSLLSGITQDAGDNPAFIWEKIGNTYRNFLFDEFQDTSVAQWDSFKSLVQNALASPSLHTIDHLIVGDTKQSIYRWRNGDWRILESKVKAHLGDFNVVDDNLEENYRSSTEIIAFNNRIYALLPTMIQHKLNSNIETTESPELLAWWRASNYDNIIADIYKNTAQHTHAHTIEGGIVKLVKITKPEDEDRIFSDTLFQELAMADTIREIQRITSELSYAYGDIGILVRRNTEASMLVQALMEAQIPVVSGDALMLAGNSAIQLLIHTLYTLVGYEQNISLHKAECLALYARIQEIDLAPEAFLDLQSKTLKQLGDYLPKALCEQAPQWIQLPLPELVERLIKAYGLDLHRASFAYLLAFRDVVNTAIRQGEKGIRSFLNWWESDGVRKTLPSPEGIDAVQVMTIHKSKGLAFRAVFIPFCNLSLEGRSNTIFWVPAQGTAYEQLGSIPLKYNKDLATSTVASYYFEESLFNHIDALNMLYVATTRAKDYLYLAVKDRKSTDNLTNTGDLLLKIHEEQWDENEQIAIEKPIARSSTKKEITPLVLEQYPTTDRMSKIFEPLEERNIVHLLHIHEAGRTGTILHQILAAVIRTDELEACVDALIVQGILSEEEKQTFITSATEVLEHPELSALLRQAKSRLAERAIVTQNGHLQRPDQILFLEDKIVVIDYKFTFQEELQHEEQVRKYVNLLKDMDYKNVEGYLFYAANKKLKAIF